MPTSLRQRLDELASSFASEVLDAIRGASLQELLGSPSGGAQHVAARVVASAPPPRAARRRAGRLPRRSAGDIAQVVESIVGLLRQTPKGLRAEEIRERLGLQAKELPRPLNEALESGRLVKSGQKRATTYFVKGASSKPAAGKQSRRAPAARVGRMSPKRAKGAKNVEKSATSAAAETEAQT